MLLIVGLTPYPFSLINSGKVKRTNKYINNALLTVSVDQSIVLNKNWSASSLEEIDVYNCDASTSHAFWFVQDWVTASWLRLM